MGTIIIISNFYPPAVNVMLMPLEETSIEEGGEIELCIEVSAESRFERSFSVDIQLSDISGMNEIWLTPMIIILVQVSCQPQISYAVPVGLK